MNKRDDLLRGAHPRDLPIYTVADAARYLHMSPSTLRSWTMGTPAGGGEGFFEPLIRIPGGDSRLLSFVNLIEAHVLLAIRTKHRVPMRKVRQALDYTQEREDIDRLLVKPELRATAGKIFLDRYGQLMSLAPAGQLAIKLVLHQHLERLERDIDGLPDNFYPFILGYPGDRILSISLGSRLVARSSPGAVFRCPFSRIDSTRAKVSLTSPTTTI